VLILSPKFFGSPKLPSPLIVTSYKSESPFPPGISDEKYNVFSSLLNVGCATEYSSLLNGKFCGVVHSPSGFL
jgi:hypothetical protein